MCPVPCESVLGKEIDNRLAQRLVDLHGLSAVEVKSKKETR